MLLRKEKGQVPVLWELYRGPFKYYVIKEVGGWGQKMTIFDDLQCCTVLKINGPLVDKK